jgi:Cys-rich repeat protein
MCSNIDRNWNTLDGTWNPVACSSDAQCGSGYTCKWKMCSTSRTTLCAADSDCPSGESCGAYLDGQGAGGSPCFQQPGYGSQMHSMPLYEWNNTMSGAQFGATHNVSFANQQDQIVPDRDFVNDQPKPGYVPYVYPHPLTTL